MKVLKGLFLFGISTLVVSCFDPPEFPLEPNIGFESIYFAKAKVAGERDLLNVTIAFRDGNGDLGLSSSNIEPPYHDLNYFLANDGDIITLEKHTAHPQLPQFVMVPQNARGKLVIAKTARDLQYANLIPKYIDEFVSCTYYTYTEVYVNEEDKHIFDENSINRVLSYPGMDKIYVLRDTFYYQRNPNYANIDVEFWVKEGNTFELFDWEKEFCTISFNQRFPVLAESERPLEGSLDYAMAASGMESIFGIKTMKLRIKIRDRSLNISNIIETPEFTLDKIKK